MAEMTFWDHLDELRKVLFRVVGVWFVLAIGYFIAMRSEEHTSELQSR